MVAIITMPRLLAVGGGALAELPSQLQRLGLTKPLVVTDPFLVHSGHLDRATAVLDHAGIPWRVFSDTVADPTTAVVEAGTRRLAEDGYDSLVAIGGGSPIDTVKVAAKRILEGSRPGAAAPHTIDFEAADVVGGPRRPADDLEPLRHRHRVGHRRRPAQNRQHGAGGPERHRHLIHDPAWCADYVVLRLLAERGQAQRIAAAGVVALMRDHGPQRRGVEQLDGAA